jgi:hypothetical protein
MALQLQLEAAPHTETLTASAFHVLDLPSEITSDIFLHFILTYPMCPPLTGPSSPELLTQICSQWRNIALSTPRLWRGIKVHYEIRMYPGLVSLPSCAFDLQTVTKWLLRSKDCPLSLSIILEMPSHLDPTPNHFAQAISAHSSRWEYIHLHLPSTAFAPLARTHFPLLLRLSFGPTDEYPNDEAECLFQEAPNLTDATLSRNFDAALTTLPWAQLTTLYTQALYPAECAYILQYTSSLVNFTCILCNNDGDRGSMVDSVPALLHLNSLTLGYDTYRQHSRDPQRGQQRVLDKLTAPVLTHLSISERFFKYDPLPSVTAFLSRSRCPLLSLEVKDARISVDNYRAAFPSSVTIEVVPDKE